MERADDDAAFERKDAIAFCHNKHNLTVPRNDGNAAAYTL
jgi:hypothetical protein